MGNATISRPVHMLREYVTSLEAAVTLCLADPRPKPVHTLRTTTRRIEAMLILLSLLRDLPPHEKPVAKARRHLKQFRRAAGHVRDLDVQIDLIQEQTTAKTGKDSRELRKVLKHQRQQAAEELVEVLEERQAKVTRALESLLKSLEPAEALSLTATELRGLAQDWFARQLARGAASDDPEAMHDLRKSAKVARYIAETAGGSARTPRKLAERFESLQRSGGEWHDWLVLSGVAEDRLGKSSLLTQVFHRRCRVALTAYKAHLDSVSS